MINYVQMVEELKKDKPSVRTEKFNELIELFSQFDNYLTSKGNLLFEIIKTNKEYVSLKTSDNYAPLFLAHSNDSNYWFHERQGTLNPFANYSSIPFCTFENFVKVFIKKVAAL